MISKRIGKLSLFAIKCTIVAAITAIAGLGFPFLQQQMTISVDGVEQVISVNGLYVEHLQQKISFGLEGDDYKYDQPVKKDMFLTDTSGIAISTKKIVELKKADDSKQVKTYVHSLSAFLEEQQIEITPPVKTESVVKLSATTNAADALRTGTILEEITREEELTVEYRDNAELEVGKEQVVQEGQTRKIVELFKTDDISTNVMLSSKTVDEGTTKIIEKGTKQPEPEPTASATAPAVPSDSVWDQLAFCESGGRWNLNTGNGYYGGLQFSAATWNTVSKKVGLNIAYAHLATREEQILAATWLQKNSGWGQWPSCTSKLGLR